MKKCFLTIAFTLFILLNNVTGATYYISSSTGNDNYSGIFIDSAWQTLEKLNLTTLFPGDSVLLKSNDSFFGTIHIQNSGTFNNPIYFGKYSSGILPEITGFKKLTGWSNIGNIYVISDTSYIRSLWCNGKWMQPARIPNSGFFSVYSSSLNSGIYSPDLVEADGYWDDASAVIRTSGFQYEIAHVNSFSQNFLTFTNPVSNIIPQFHGFFLQNHLSALDTLNEWYCDTVFNQVLLIPPALTNINSADVEASVINYGVLCNTNCNNIIFDGLHFGGQAIDGIRFNNSALNIKIKNCAFDKIRQCAIRFFQTTDVCKILNNKINDCGGDAISCEFLFHGLINNNEIHRTGIHVGFGLDNINQAMAIHLSSAIYDTISDNFIDSTCYNAISLYNFGNQIERNFINHTSLNLDAGAGISLFGAATHHIFIKDNFIINTIGNIAGTKYQYPFSVGISISDYCHTNSVINNTIVNSDSYGIYVGPNNHDHYIKDNVLYNNQKGQLFITDGDPINSTNQIELHNNILYSLNDQQKVLQLSGKSYDFFPLKGDSNYYCNPYNYFPIYQQINFDTIHDEKVFSLSAWNKTTLQDSNAHVSNVEWQNYFTTDTTGSDLIVNGNFTNNYDNWHTDPLNNNELLLDNLTMMDNGCVKFEVTDTLPYDYGKIVSNNFQLLNNAFYQLSFSTSGRDDRILQSYISYQTPPYSVADLLKYFPLSTNRKNFIDFFHATNFHEPVALNFKLYKSDSLVYFDNIHLFQVNVFKHDSTRMSVLIMNYSAFPVNVPLGADSVFRDLDGNLVSGSYTLNPYASYVLVLDSPLHLLAIKEMKKQNSIQVFPNPIQSFNGNINVQLPDENEYDYDVYDLAGRKFLSGKFSGSTIHTFSMHYASAGIYFLSIHSANNLWQQKIVVVN